VALLQLVTCFDWISPCIAILQSIANGDPLGTRSWTFYVPLDCSWSGARIEKLLKSNGVKIWARMIHGHDLFFRVHKKQAEWAEYVLLRAGVPLKYRLYSERNLQYRYAQPAKRQAVEHPLLAMLNDLLGLL
jgi:hypothetical protein